MPELAEVEIMGRNLRRWLLGRRVVGLDVLRGETVRAPGEAALRDALLGADGIQIHRRGKALLLHGSGRRLGVIVRFGMTGKVVLEEGELPRAGARLRIVAVGADPEDRARVAYVDARNLGSFTPVPLPDEPADALAEAVGGQDAWLHPPSAEALRGWGAATRRPVKVFLMEQRPVAGIGNILATEILFRARVRPDRPADALTPAEWEAVAEAIPLTIAKVLESEEGDEIHLVGEAGSPNPFAVYGRAGAPCPRCEHPLDRLVLAGRGSVFCPACQAP